MKKVKKIILMILIIMCINLSFTITKAYAETTSCLDDGGAIDNFTKMGEDALADMQVSTDETTEPFIGIVGEIWPILLAVMLVTSWLVIGKIFFARMTGKIIEPEDWKKLAMQIGLIFAVFLFIELIMTFF